MSERKGIRSKEYPIWAISSIALFVVITLWWAGAMYMWFRFPNPADRGMAGDSFGGITALFSGLAFSALIITLAMQRRELSLQRFELEATRKVMREQTEHIAKQNFESTFFRMLENFYNLVDSIDYDYNRISYSTGNIKSKTTTYVGRDAIKHFAKVIYVDTTNLVFDQNNNAVTNEKGWEERFKSSYQKYESDIGHYHRMIYRIVSYVDQHSTITENEKVFYIEIVRSSFSSDECRLIFVNGLSEHAEEKMKPLIEKYALLKHLPKKYRLWANFLSERYSDSAFEE